VVPHLSILCSVAAHDVVIRNGVVVDGSGMPRVRADVAIDGRHIAEVGVVPGKGRREIDAEGHVVSPGFVDAHTHMDAQLFWDPLCTSSCWHGVTSAVMGNCGFTLAPVRSGAHQLVFDNLEKAEDIPAASLAAGVQFEWESFRDYVATVERLPKGINVAVQVGHSALRTYVMGERAFTDTAGDDDLALLERELLDGLDAGAIGFTTSRSEHHSTPDGRPVASRVAGWPEIERLVRSAGDVGGLFELANESVMTSPDPDARSQAMARIRALAVSTKAQMSFGITAYGDRNRWRELLDLLDDAATDGGRVWGQSSCRPAGAVFNLRTWLPFDKLPHWRDVRALPLDEQVVRLGDPDLRRTLAEAVGDGSFTLGKEAATSSIFERLMVLLPNTNEMPTLAEVARRRDAHPVDVMIDLALDGTFLFQVTGNDDPDDVLTILRHPRTVMTFSDAGAHVSQIVNASLQTHLLSYWVRQRQSLTLEEAVRMLTLVPSTVWGFTDRGLVRPGMVADLNVFDPSTVGAAMPEVVNDFPAGATRLIQRSNGFLSTIVGGEPTFENGEHTGALAGRLLRRRAGA
jgi:N-acyl-D-amino-acid deacylase